MFVGHICGLARQQLPKLLTLPDAHISFVTIQTNVFNQQ